VAPDFIPGDKKLISGYEFCRHPGRAFYICFHARGIWLTRQTKAKVIATAGSKCFRE
jgi:hypothetical protein